MNLYQLYKTIFMRKRPEDVAAMVMELIGNELTKAQHITLNKAAKGSLKNRFMQYTSMMQSFAMPSGANRQVNKAAELFRLDQVPEVDGHDPEAIEGFIKKLSPQINKTFGKNDFMHHRLNRLSRKAIGLDISKRRYNKLFRHLQRMETKLEGLIAAYKKRAFQQVAKHGIVHRLSYDMFAQDKYTACFIAYYTARCNLRSEFTVNGQTRPFDKISQMLLKLSEDKGTPNYLAMAYVYPVAQTLEKLSDHERGQLLGKWTSLLEELAGMLKKLWHDNQINKETMVVKRGNDSSTWNITAGAWNKARDAWMNMIYAMGAEFVLDTMCFGKVMRLIAGDLAAWHRTAGSGLEPNTQVWQRLPLPWEVFEGEATCNKSTVKRACQRAGLDPELSGWIAPRTVGVAEFTPTPELVHGVSVANPFLATLLKKQGVFSGKKLKPLKTNLN
ncbi:hypothetical protein [Microscilla marina]|nr:hypothetical protein [Microscilla marina]